MKLFPLLSIELISAIPLFLVFLDYYRRSNIHKAIGYLIAFFLVIFVVEPLLFWLFSWYLIIVIPFLIFIYAFLMKYLNSKK